MHRILLIMRIKSFDKIMGSTVLLGKNILIPLVFHFIIFILMCLHLEVKYRESIVYCHM